MINLESRPIQTKVKHEILQEYLASWGYIITMGLRGAYLKAQQSDRKLSTRFVYVDCFSYMGAYSPEEGQPIYGSPIIGVNAIDRIASNFRQQNLVTPDTYTILVEENKDNYRVLLDTLKQCNLDNRIRETTNFQSLKPGEIALINDDYTRHLKALIDFTNRNFTWSFYLLDPYGPKSIPLDFVQRIISQEHTDVIINLMYQDLHKKTGSAAKNHPDPRHISLLGYWDAVYGDNSWRNIAQKYYAEEISKEEMENRLVELYRNILLDKDAELAVKRIPLRFPDKDRTMFYLFLTTHDGTGALKMNEILDGAKISEFAYREKAKAPDQKSFFDLDLLPDPMRSQQNETNIDDIANAIYKIGMKQTLTFRSLLAQLADTPYYIDQVRKAMTKLKRSHKCTYNDLSHKDLITFT